MNTCEFSADGLGSKAQGSRLIWPPLVTSGVLGLCRALWDGMVILLALFTTVLQLWLIAFLIRRPSYGMCVMEILLVRSPFLPAAVLSLISA